MSLLTKRKGLRQGDTLSPMLFSLVAVVGKNKVAKYMDLYRILLRVGYVFCSMLAKLSFT
jgi:hypothetical protein